MANNTSVEHVEFSNENVINAVQTQPTLCDPTVKANEEQKENRVKMHCRFLWNQNWFVLFKLLHRPIAIYACVIFSRCRS